MHRRSLLSLLDRYQGLYPAEEECLAQVRLLVTTHADCFQRSCLPGHITASAWIVTPDHQQFLMTHHRKLGRWLQLGGHADGDPSPENVALREAREESGMHEFEVLHPGFERVPIDVDVHEIPARGSDPAHAHHDLRYLLVAKPGQVLMMSDESLDLRWFANGELQDLDTDESVLRLARKARALLASREPRQPCSPQGKRF